MGLMQDFPLTLQMVMRHAQEQFPNREVVSLLDDGSVHRSTYSACFARAARLANVLTEFGVQTGDRIATLGWNHYRHFELYYGISCSGAVCHTLNPRLFADQIEYIVNDAADSWIFTDPDFLPVIEPIIDRLPSVKGVVVLADNDYEYQGSLPAVKNYEELLAGASEEYTWPELDERQACSLCYTSGTTGNPKGVLYSHRALTIHTFAAAMPDNFCLSAFDCVMPIVPMFHANCWSMPYACPSVGAKLVLPGSRLADGERLTRLMQDEEVTFSLGVPTVWLSMLNYMHEKDITVPSLRRVGVGGTAPPVSLIKGLEQRGIELQQVWGMTEMSPLGVVNRPKPGLVFEDEEERLAHAAKQGRTVFGVQMKIVDEENRELPRDGVAFGALKVAGPWIIERYFGKDESALDEDGWFDTGDVATLDTDGYMQITDRAKDVIKSGGEWISSIDLENLAMGHPAVAEATVIGAYHSRWDERPLLVAVKRKGADVSREELLAFFEGKVARWWQPDDCVFVDELPHTGTGKLDKKRVRDKFRDYRLLTDSQ